MTPILAELVSITAEGMAFLVSPLAEMTQVEAWLQKRQAAFGPLAARLNLTDDERPVATQVIAEILALDARLLSRLQDRLGDLGKDILNARRVQDAIGGSAQSHPPVLFQRAV